MTDPVLFEERAAGAGRRIGIATLNAPRALNALSLPMIDALQARLAAWAADPAVALVVLQGEGDRALCAGADLHALYREMRAHPAARTADGGFGAPYSRAFFEREYRLDYFLHTYPKPLLCWGHGIVMGGGIGLMVGASHRVVTEQSRLAMPEVSIGLFPDVGASWFLNRMPGKAGLLLGLTGAQLGAADALFVGWADYCIGHDRKEDMLAALAQQPWSGARRADDALLDALLKRLQGAELPAPGPLRRNLDRVNALCSGATLPAIVDALRHGSHGDPWLDGAVATMTAGAPSTVRLAYELQRRARHLSLADVFKLEFSVATLCTARPDLAEGIRALLIDKDRRPAWQPATLEAADEAWADAFFAEASLADGAHPMADLG
ncbi:enoyl-CoA hydratase/isomerase family protein [Pigmentiphaga soli]|uniref:3-hydroxyisobutyryl-CoA hydrolase n=1 Tax=Pigmentiphaga soli TaxID=1007095 RepID=A0ABP8HK11_9BURK